MEKLDKSTNPTEVPIGGIIIWSGSGDNFNLKGKGINLMVNWAICNGKNNTPNLTNKFIRCSDDPDDVGHTGGNDSINLTVDNIPNHSHSMNHAHTITDPGHAHNNGVSFGQLNLQTGNDGVLWSANKNLHTYTIAAPNKTGIIVNEYQGHTAPVGNGEPISTIPQYYSLFYIMKIS